MEHYMTFGPLGHRYRLPDDTDPEQLRARINAATAPIEIGAVTEDATQVTFWLNPQADPWWSLESYPD